MSREQAVVVTGLGMVTSIGTGREEFWMPFSPGGAVLLQ